MADLEGDCPHYPDQKDYYCTACHEAELTQARSERDLSRKALESAGKEAERYRLALEKIAKAEEPGANDGDCCYGNYSDAHDHGAALGEWFVAKIAKEALRPSSARGGKENS